ncbi:MAG: NAD-dependent epimerase/dehydratase family protein [Magnetococcales bacterium]|nr:NAD-dependent epimerase/dehydratase family protein [Magnetococcales bacterium]
MSYHQARILIAGGLGFIGSRLANRLSRAGAQVTVVDNLWQDKNSFMESVSRMEARIDLHLVDVRNHPAMTDFIKSHDILFNLAGAAGHMHSIRNPRQDLAGNVSSALSLLENCRRHNPGITIVYASTRQIYGKPRYLPVNEEHPIDPLDIHSIHKATADFYHRRYHEIHHLDCRVLRLTNTYGPGMAVKDDRHGFIGAWIGSLLESSPIRIFGNGAQRRDFNHVDDCVEALLLAGQTPSARGRIYNLGGQEQIALKELAEMMILLIDGASYQLIPYPPKRQPIETGDYFGDFSRATRELHWSPAIGLRDGLFDTLHYYQNRPNRLTA